MKKNNKELKNLKNNSKRIRINKKIQRKKKKTSLFYKSRSIKMKKMIY